MQLVICEKPSQAQGYSAVLGANKRENGFFIGNNYIVTYCYGHLLELAAPDAYGDYAKWKYADLPIIPQAWKHVPSKARASQLKILKELMNRADVDCVINAADAGREGEIIFRNVYDYAKCRKPIKRLWISSMTDATVRAGFANLKDGADYENLYAAASCRERADWCVGINATRAFSCLYGGATLNVYDYSISSAYEYLSECGYTDLNGDGLVEIMREGELFPLELEIIVNSNIYNPQREDTAEQIVSQLQNIGIQATLTTLDFETYQMALSDGNYDLAMCGFYLAPYPDFKPLFTADGTNNYAGYESEEMQTLMDEVQNAPDEQSYILAVRAMCEKINADLPVISLYFRTRSVIYDTKLNQVSIPSDTFMFGNINNWYMER